ncbi:hypothetical protein ACH4VM_15770 [Streptomyces sp. NPDC020792]|uniref:hypothetical protein n=1 Tax=Streptomyces sp. NPDC020792 TaxID=3365089 RepID=UPI003793FFB8
MIAGGIGLAPLRPVVHAVLDRPDVYGRLTVLVGTRTPADLVYREETINAARPQRGARRRGLPENILRYQDHRQISGSLSVRYQGHRRSGQPRLEPTTARFTAPSVRGGDRERGHRRSG